MMLITINRINRVPAGPMGLEGPSGVTPLRAEEQVEVDSVEMADRIMGLMRLLWVDPQTNF
jgi:hypothetical protein